MHDATTGNKKLAKLQTILKWEIEIYGSCIQNLYRISKKQAANGKKKENCENAYFVYSEVQSQEWFMIHGYKINYQYLGVKFGWKAKEKTKWPNKRGQSGRTFQAMRSWPLDCDTDKSQLPDLT